MTIETTLQVRIGEDYYVLHVKMIRLGDASYFFINDHVPEKPLLEGKTLELTYTGSFSLTEFGGVIRSPDIPMHFVVAIQTEILDNERAWFY